MVFLDTSVWIEFFRGREPFFSQVEELVETGQVVSHAVVFAELLQGAKSKRECDLLLEYWVGVKDSESEAGLIEGGLLACREKLAARGVGLIDAIIIFETRRRKCRIWTLDKKILSFISSSERYTGRWRGL